MIFCLIIFVKIFLFRLSPRREFHGSALTPAKHVWYPDREYLKEVSDT